MSASQSELDDGPTQAHVTCHERVLVIADVIVAAIAELPEGPVSPTTDATVFEQRAHVLNTSGDLPYGAADVHVAG